MNKYFLVNPKASALVAVFEVNNNKVFVSAALGAIIYKYKEQMSIDDARRYYKQLLDENWVKCINDGTSKFSGHEYVWNLYR